MDPLLRLAIAAVQDGVLESLVDGRERDVVIQELSELHDHERVASVEMRDVIVDGGRDGSRGRKAAAGHRAGSGC